MRTSFWSKLFHWNPSVETFVALAAGLVVIGLSAAMLPFSTSSWFAIIIRDILMIALVGIAFPLYCIRQTHMRWQDFGLTLKKWYIFVPINLFLALLLFLLFLSDKPPAAGFVFNSLVLQKSIYIMLAGVFETVFFYSFLRTIFYRAFGAVPAVILAAVFYAFHHIGFQPEYGKLIMVGLLYAIPVQIANSVLVIYPFYWGIGGLYDVLIQSKTVAPVYFPGIRTVYLVILILVMTVWILRTSKIKE